MNADHASKSTLKSILKTYRFKLLIAVLFLQFGKGFAQNVSFADTIYNYTRKGDYIGALDYTDKLASGYIKKRDYLKYSIACIQKADIYFTLNDNEKALGTLFTAIRVVQHHNEKTGEVLLYRKIAMIYSLMHDLDKAADYNYQALAKAKKIKNDTLVGSIYQPLYKIHMSNKSDSAVFYLKKTMEHHKKTGTASAMAKAYNNYFYYYHDNGQNELARKYIDSALYYARKSGSRIQLSLELVNYAGFLINTDKNYKKAKELYEEMFRINPDTTSIESAGDYFTYANILAHLGQYKDAYWMNEKAALMMDDNYDRETKSALRDIEMRYKIDKIEEKRAADRKRSDEQQFRYRRIGYILFAVFALTLILFYFFYQNTKLKQKNKLRDIESQIQQNLLTATIDGQETERKKIATVLHDNISAMLSSAGLQLTAFVSGQEKPSQEITKAREILKTAHDKVRDLSHELMPTLLAKFGLEYALQDLCEKNSNSAITFDFSTDGSIRRRYQEDFEMKLYFITSELLNNVLKHSEATNAKLLLSQENGRISITVEDNGKGFDTSKPSGEGFGLTQIRARVSALKGSIAIHSRPGAGTFINLRIPVQE